jgi:MFS family permease
MVFASFPLGKLIDKVGRKVPIIVSSFLVIPAVLLFVYGNYLTLFIAMPLMGVSMLLGFSSYQSLFADLVPQEHRGKITGSMNFFFYLFMALGGVGGGILYETISPQLPFLLTIAFAIPSIALVFFCVQEPKPEKREA